MLFSRSNNETLLLSQLDAVLVDLLRRISSSADPTDCPAARARLFSPPTHDSREKGLLADWPRYVEPELARLFQSALDVIEADLQGLKIDSAQGEATLAIPLAHLESWIHGINQARLAIAARHGITDEEVEPNIQSAPAERALAMLQLQLYGALESLFLDQLEDS